MKAFASAVAGLSLLTSSVALAAPAQLLNKTIVITWSESIQEKTEDGRLLNTSLSRERIAYVSSAGRVFVKTTQRIQSAQKSAEVAPGSSPGSLSFQGNSMVGTSVFGGFARRLTVTFDASFASCTIAVAYGKSGGPQKWKSVDGKRTLEPIAIAVGSTSCSIRDGNALAT